VRRRLLIALCLAAMVAGCQDPYGADPGSEHEPALGQSETAPESEHAHGDELAPAARADDTAPAPRSNAQTTPRAAVAAFCAQWINWSWRTIARQQLRLAELATGALARELAAEAKRGVRDETLRRDRLGARGSVVAVALRPGDAGREAVCVAREERLEAGRAELAGGAHRVYLATVERTRSGWAVRRWEPQP
jgi:hypothetical protein